MNRFLFAAIAGVCGLLFSPEAQAQSARLEVRVLSAARTDSPIPLKVQNATRTSANAPQMKLEATALTTGGAPLAATLEWYVLGRGIAAAPPGPAALVLMQSSKEAISAKPAPGAKTTLFTYAPGQVRNDVRSEGWIARLLAADGRLLDLKASDARFATLGRDAAQLAALEKARAGAEATGADGEVPLPPDVVARIKLEAEKKWPNSAEMQAFEIKMLTDAHRAAYRK